jgi:tRNA(Ile2) C34 agmatinyltransferase TiaS
MDKRSNYKGKRNDKRDNKMPAKKCPHCGCDMKAKGASDCVGGISFKCKSSKCGRRVWVRKNLAHPPIPMAPRERNYFSNKRN